MAQDTPIPPVPPIDGLALQMVTVAQGLRARGEHAAAVAHLRDAANMRIDHSLPSLLLADLYEVELGDYEQAAECIKGACGHDVLRGALKFDSCYLFFVWFDLKLYFSINQSFLP